MNYNFLSLFWHKVKYFYDIWQIILKKFQIMISYKRIILLLLITYFHNNFFSQVVEIPQIKNVSVNRNSGMVEIIWAMKNTDKVDGYIVKRKIFGQPNVVDGSFNTIANINNKHQLRYIDSTDAYGYAAPDQRAETYRVVAYKNDTANKVIYSNMSKSVSSIYLQPVEFDLCAKQNKLQWTAFKGYENELKAYRIYYSHEPKGKPVYVNEVSATDTFFVHENVQSDKKYYYYIKAVSEGGLFSLSNSQLIHTQEFAKTSIMNANHASVIKKGHIEVSFTVDKNSKTKSYMLLRLISEKGVYDTIAHFKGGVENITYVDTLKTNKNIVYYKLLAINECNDVFAKSNIAHNILLKARASETEQFINNLTWNKCDYWLGGVAAYIVYRRYESMIFKKIAELPSNTTSYVDDVKKYIDTHGSGLSSDGKFCYYIEAIEGTDNPHGITSRSKSNKSCTYQESVVYLPNAINPNSSAVENRTFRPVSSFVSNYQLIIYDRWGGIVFK